MKISRNNYTSLLTGKKVCSFISYTVCLTASIVNVRSWTTVKVILAEHFFLKDQPGLAKSIWSQQH